MADIWPKKGVSLKTMPFKEAMIPKSYLEGFGDHPL